MSNSNMAGSHDNSAEPRTPSSADIASASADMAAALHGDKVRQEVYAVVEASLEAEMEGIRRLNAVRRRFGRPELVIEIGGWWHDCYGTRKPIPEPTRKPGEPPLYKQYWHCEKLADGCYSCGYIEVVETHSAPV